MTRYANQSLAALAALALAIGMWLPTVAPVSTGATHAVAVLAVPEMA